MNSTFSFDPNLILKVSDLSISYRLSYRGIDSVRDLFIKAVHNPVRLLFREKRTLDLLNHLDLELRKGERLGILGVNGTGKTSLCRTIAGMHGKNKNIFLNGEVRAIFESSVVVQPELSGAENAWILTNLLYNKHPKEERKKIIEEALEFSELNEFVYSPFKTYSKGMKARLFLSVVSARPCDLLILDEVFSGADIFFNEKISNRVQEMIEDSGAVIFISHHLDLIKKICNRVVVL
ncbi:MAG: ATP-binding cassette domain-containing protein, partial [Bacteriovoracaceae bacterium]